MAESEGELWSFLMKMKEESKKLGLKLNIKETKIMESGPIAVWQKKEKKEAVADCFLRLQSHCRQWLQPWN